MDRKYLLFSVFGILIGMAKTEGSQPSIHYRRNTTLHESSSSNGSALLCANRQTLRRVDLDTLEFSTIVSNLSRSVAVDYHYAKGLVIWTDVVTEKIYSSPLATSGPVTKLVDVCVTPDGIAVDWIHDNLYWTDTGKDTIGVALLNGALWKTLFDRQLDEPRAIVLDPLQRWMFWTDWGGNPKIERSGMDGSHRSVIVSNGIQWPNGLAIDLESRRIYWADGKTHVLASTDYEGGDEQVLISSPTIMKHPFALDLLGDWLYWTEWSALRESIYKAKKLTGGDVTQVIGGRNWTSLMGIRVYDISKQPPGPNQCGSDNGGCSHLCLPSPDVEMYTCACPDGVLPSDNCSTVSTRRVDPVTSTVIYSTTTPNTVTATVMPGESTSPSSDIDEHEREPTALRNSTNERQNQEIEGGTGVPAGAIIGILVGLALMALVVFYMHKQFSKRTDPPAFKSEGWTGIDNPVYCKTTEDGDSLPKIPT